MNYIEILERFKYESDDNIKGRITALDKENHRENRDIINSIVLWKLNRSIFVITSYSIHYTKLYDIFYGGSDVSLY